MSVRCASQRTATPMSNCLHRWAGVANRAMRGCTMLNDSPFVRERARPNAELLSSRGRIFETLPFHWTRFADGLRGFYGRFTHFPIGNVLGKKQVGHFLTRRSTRRFNG